MVGPGHGRGCLRSSHIIFEVHVIVLVRPAPLHVQVVVGVDAHSHRPGDGRPGLVVDDAVRPRRVVRVQPDASVVLVGSGSGDMHQVIHIRIAHAADDGRFPAPLGGGCAHLDTVHALLEVGAGNQATFVIVQQYPIRDLPTCGAHC